MPDALLVFALLDLYKGFGGFRTIIQNPQNSISNELGPYSNRPAPPAPRYRLVAVLLFVRTPAILGS